MRANLQMKPNVVLRPKKRRKPMNEMMPPEDLVQYNEIEALFENETLQSVEDFAEGFNADAFSAHRRYILTLQFIKEKELFRQSPRYEHADAKQYLRDRWNMTPSTLFSIYRAYIMYPNASELLGTGPVMDAIKICVPQKVPQAIDEMVQEHTGFKKGLIPSKKEQIIKKYKIEPPPKASIAKPLHHPPKITHIRDWQHDYSEVEKERIALLKENKELKLQIAKLKATHIRLKSELALAGEQADEFKTSLEKWAM
jgi:hypothetical protein